LKEINLRFLAESLKSLDLNKYAKVSEPLSISQSVIYEKSIPVPPIEIQEKLVKEIEYQEKNNRIKQKID
jgi:restriction endonuclease S subunit